MFLGLAIASDAFGGRKCSEDFANERAEALRDKCLNLANDRIEVRRVNGSRSHNS